MSVGFRGELLAHLDLLGYKGKWDKKVRMTAITDDLLKFNKKCIYF